MLSTPIQVFPVFPATVSLLPLITPEDALDPMEIRESRLRDEIAEIDEEVQTNAVRLPRLFLLEAEYMRIMLEAELKWVRSVSADLHSGQLIWNQEWARPGPPRA